MPQPTADPAASLPRLDTTSKLILGPSVRESETSFPTTNGTAPPELSERGALCDDTPLLPRWWNGCLPAEPEESRRRQMASVPRVMMSPAPAWVI
jgi:hypothetical protein